MSTILGHKHSIKHPGYGDSSDIWRRRSDFWFSEDIEKWITTKNRNKKTKYHETKEQI